MPIFRPTFLGATLRAVAVGLLIFYGGVVVAIGPAVDLAGALDAETVARAGEGALLARIRTRPALPATRAGDEAIVTVTPDV